MARLVYLAIGSLDGYVVDAQGSFAWAEPSEEVLDFVNDEVRGVGTYLYGRRMHEVMEFWEDAPADALSPGSARFAEIWRAADKVVVSTTLAAARTRRTTVQRGFDVPAVARLKEESGADLGIGGPTLAAHALRAGLVDEVHLVLAPTVVGGGTPFFPPDLRLDLTLVDQRRFANGMVSLRYAVGAGAGPHPG